MSLFIKYKKSPATHFWTRNIPARTFSKNFQKSTLIFSVLTQLSNFHSLTNLTANMASSPLVEFTIRNPPSFVPPNHVAVISDNGIDFTYHHMPCNFRCCNGPRFIGPEQMRKMVVAIIDYCSNNGKWISHCGFHSLDSELQVGFASSKPDKPEYAGLNDSQKEWNLRQCIFGILGYATIWLEEDECWDVEDGALITSNGQQVLCPDTLLGALRSGNMLQAIQECPVVTLKEGEWTETVDHEAFGPQFRKTFFERAYGQDLVAEINRRMAQLEKEGAFNAQTPMELGPELLRRIEGDELYEGMIESLINILHVNDAWVEFLHTCGWDDGQQSFVAAS